MNRIRIRRPRARSERPWPGGLSAGPPGPGIVRARGARADRAAALVVTSVPPGLRRAGERASTSPHPEGATQDRLDIRSHIDTAR